MQLRRVSAFLAASIVLASAAVNGCHDAPTVDLGEGGAMVHPEDNPSFLIACDGSATSCVDNRDTHVTADISFTTTYTSTTAASFVDPVTGATTNVLSVNTPPLQVHVDAGYLPNGAPRVMTSYTAGADPATLVAPQVVRQDLTGDALAELNASDAQLSFNPPPEMAAASR